MASSKKGISSHQLHRTLEITYKSASFLTHRIREAMKELNIEKLLSAYIKEISISFYFASFSFFDISYK